MQTPHFICPRGLAVPPPGASPQALCGFDRAHFRLGPGTAFQRDIGFVGQSGRTDPFTFLWMWLRTLPVPPPLELLDRIHRLNVNACMARNGVALINQVRAYQDQGL